MADGASFQIDVGVQAGGVVGAAAALDALTDRLTAAGAASTAAAKAVEEGERAYKQAETTADRAAKAVEKIGLAADAQRGKLQAALEAGDAKGVDAATAKIAALTQRQTEAVAKAQSASSALAQEAASLDKLKAASAAAEANERNLSKQMTDQTAAAKAAAKAQATHGEASEGASVNLRALSGALGRLGGPAGAAGQQVAALGGAVQRLSKTLGAAGPYVAAAVLVFAIATAALAATIAITKFGIAQADAARTSRLLSDGIAGSVGGGRELDDAISKVGAKVPQTREELTAMASDLAKTGLRGVALSKALDDAATKAAKLKWGPDFAKQMLSLDVQGAHLKDNVSKIFSGLNIEPLLTAVQHALALFDSTSASAKAIKTIFETLFQPVVDSATAMIPKVETAFLDIIIWTLKAIIAIKPYSAQILLVAKAFGVIALLVVAAIAVVIGVIVAVVAQIVAFVALVIYLQGVFEGAGRSVREFGSSVIDGAGAAFDSLEQKVEGALDYLRSISLADIGAQMIAGLIQGIEGAGGAVVDSLGGVVNKSIDGVKGLLGIHSPSTVFEEQIGAQMGAGIAGGVEKSGGEIQSALENVTSPDGASVSANATGANAKPGGSSSSSSSAISGNTFILNGVQGADDAITRMKELFTELIDGDMTQLGEAVPTS